MTFFKKNIFYITFQNLNKVLFSKYKKKSILVFLMALLSSIFEVLGLAVILPVITVVLDSSIIHSNNYLQNIYTLFGFTSDIGFSIFLLVSLFLVFVFKNAFSLLVTYWQSKFSLKISTDIARTQFKRYYLKNLQFFNDNNSNLLYQNIRSASTWLSLFILIPLIGFLSEFVVVIIILIGMIMYDSKIFFLVALSLAPVFLLVYRLIKNKLSDLEKSKALQEVDASKNLLQGINGYVDVKLFNKDDYFINKYVDVQEQMNNSQSKIFALQGLPTKTIEVTAVTGVICIILYSMFQPSGKNLIPLLSLYVVAAYRLMPSMNRMFLALMSIRSYQFLFDILKDMKEESRLEKLQKTDEIIFNSQIQLKDISFNYPEGNNFSLKNINITIRKGERIGFIGQSGSGKTTLINIFLRFLTEEKGAIVIDDKIHLNDTHTNAWRNLIGYVKQNVFIVDGDFYDNIAFGIERNAVNVAKLEKAVKSARLDVVVSKLPEGLSTNIGENGTKLSGGQRQRIAIARALYKDAQILIFDEATSALDNETEKEITEAIDSLSAENKTMLIIAHRISTLKNCDRVFELAEGVVARECSYNELINN